MFSLSALHKDPLTLVAEKLPSRDIGNIRGTCKYLRDSLKESLHWSIIAQNNPTYSDEMRRETAHVLACYVDHLVEGFKGKNLKEIHDYAAKQRAQLSADSEQEKLNQKAMNTSLSKLKEELDAILAEIESCAYEPKKQLCRQDYQAKSEERLEAFQKESDRVRFVQELMDSKGLLLSLEYLVHASKVAAAGELTKIPYEQHLIKTFRNRVQREVDEVSTRYFDRAIKCAQLQLNSRLYLVPFSSSPATIAPYLRQLERNLVSEVQQKYEPSCFDQMVAWWRGVSWLR